MLSQERLKELVNYNLDTGEFTDRITGGPIGKDIDGYLYQYIEGTNYPLHRLAFLYVEGVIPKTDIDHRNMVRSDNRFRNLRACTRSQNMYNTGPHCDSKLKVKNVSFRSDTGKFSVRVSINGKYQTFGCFDDLELAELVATEVRNKYHGEYARHL